MHAVAGINALIRVYNSIPFLPNVSQISVPQVSVPTVTIPKTTTATPSIPTISVPSVSASTGTGSTTTSGGGVTSAVSGAARVGGGFTDSQNAARLAAMGAGGFTDSQNAARINVTVNGAIDAEGTARTIIDVLNRSSSRGTLGAGQFSYS